MISPDAILTFALLAAAIVSLWCSHKTAQNFIHRHVWLFVFGMSLPAAMASGALKPAGLVGIGVFATAVWFFARPGAGKFQRMLSASVILLLSVGFMLHRVPGFNNPQVITATKFSTDAIPFTLYLNYDKTLIGLFLLGWCHVRISRAGEWIETLRKTLPIAAGLIALMMVLSVAAGYVRFDPKFPEKAWLWMGANLLFTCVAEEALFRGFIQAQLQRLWENTRHGQLLALTAAALLFGLAHAAGGVMYVILATIAGLGYGWVYQRSGKIEASILTHFTLNAVHFFGFTYPALQRAM
jgi:membrane protease YdiL (CAAX protease family)